MAGVRGTPNKNGKYEGWYYDRHGERCWTVGTVRKRETADLMARKETLEKEIALGIREAPNACRRHARRVFAEVVQEYIDWGEMQGGRKGRPWSPVHARNKRSRLEWWREELDLRTLGDLNGILGKAEAVLRKLGKKGRAGKTLLCYASALQSFCRWCVDREYLEDDPLRRMSSFDLTPKSKRRAATREEIHRLLAVAPLDRRLLCEVAFCTGLRARELASLTLAHLDTERGGLVLDAEWTKNREPGFQPLPSALVERLKTYGESGRAAELYRRKHVRRDATAKLRAAPLLFVPSHPARELDKDLKAAGIPKTTAEGKLDFHACRNAYVTFVVEAGASAKEAQDLARHSTPQLTMNVYARSREGRRSELAERVGEIIGVGERGICVGTPLETESAQVISKGAATGCDRNRMVEAAGIEPEAAVSTLDALPYHIPTTIDPNPCDSRQL
jgi:integrase